MQTVYTVKSNILSTYCMINYYKLISLFSIQIVLSSDLPCIIDEEHFVPDRFNRGVAKKNWKRKTERRSENFALQQKPKTALLGGSKWMVF